MGEAIGFWGGDGTDGLLFELEDGYVVKVSFYSC